MSLFVPDVAELPEETFRIERFAPVGRKRGQVILLPELWGIVPQICGMAARFAAEGFDVFVPDLLPGVLEPTSDREAIAARYSAADDRSAMRKIAFLAERIGGAEPAGPTLVVGFCYGGRMAIHAAAHVRGIDGVISFYGMYGTPSAKALDPRRSALDAEVPVQAHYGALDPSIPPDDVDFARSALRLGRVFSYPEAGHAFMNETRESYRPAAAQEAWARVLDFLREREQVWSLAHPVSAEPACDIVEDA